MGAIWRVRRNFPNFVACQTVRTEPTQYVSVAECNAAAESALNRYTGLSYPVVAVRCQKAATPMIVTASLNPAG
jgi:hypothetical protein